MIRGILPHRHITAMIIILSLVMPVHFTLWIFLPPQGTVFNGYDDSHALLYAVTASVKRDFQSMWILDDEPVPKSIFLNPNNGHIYTFVLIGMVSLFAGLPVVLVYVFVLFLAGVLLLLSCYHLIGLLTGNRSEHEMCFIIFSLSAGLGVFFQILNIAANGITALSFIGMGTNVYRTVGLYPSVAIIPAMLSIIFIIRKKPLYSGVFLALAGVLLPYIALPAFIVNILYVVLEYRQRIKNSIKMLAVPAAASLVWIVPYAQNSLFFSYYYSLNFSINHVFLPSIVLGMGLAFLFLFYELYNETTPRRIKGMRPIFIYIIMLVLFSVAELFDPFVLSTETGFVQVLQSYSLSWLTDAVTGSTLLFELPFIAALAVLLTASAKSWRSGRDKRYTFVLVWFFIVSLLFFIPSRYTGLLSNRFFFFFYIPASVIATKGIVRFSATRRALSAKKIVAAAVVLSIPSIVAYNIFFQLAPREHYTRSPLESFEFYSAPEYRALQFLRTQPDGVVMAPLYISFYTPFHAEKRPLLSGESPGAEGIISYNQAEKRSDYSRFYSTGTAMDEKKSILGKYGISYIFYTRYESDVLGASADNLPFLENIYDSGGVTIYRYNG